MIMRNQLKVGTHLQSIGGPVHCGVKILAIDDAGVTVRRVHFCHNQETYQMRWNAVDKENQGILCQWEFAPDGQLPLL